MRLKAAHQVFTPADTNHSVAALLPAAGCLLVTFYVSGC